MQEGSGSARVPVLVVGSWATQRGEGPVVATHLPGATWLYRAEEGGRRGRGCGSDTGLSGAFRERRVSNWK